MQKNSQISITIGTLGIMLILIGLFPGIVGLETVQGVGVLQVLVMMIGFSLMFAAAYIFVKQTFYPGQPTTLAQDIGIRLTLTGLLIAAAAGLADVLGFGSHPPTTIQRPLLGYLQTAFLVGGILIGSLGVLVYTLFGATEDMPNPSNNDENEGHPLARD